LQRPSQGVSRRRQGMLLQPQLRRRLLHRMHLLPRCFHPQV
jgi:hypothetical protein